MMNRNFNRGKKIMFFIPVAIALALVLGYVVMFLWNWILPEVAHVGKLKYWQALGLLVLCRLLFGNFRHGGHGPGFGHGGKGMRDKWRNMSEEDRNRFRDEYRKRFR